jgi:hypothetical protein
VRGSIISQVEAFGYFRDHRLIHERSLFYHPIFQKLQAHFWLAVGAIRVNAIKVCVDWRSCIRCLSKAVFRASQIALLAFLLTGIEYGQRFFVQTILSIVLEEFDP